jgi:hypothetical protein
MISMAVQLTKAQEAVLEEFRFDPATRRLQQKYGWLSRALGASYGALIAELQERVDRLEAASGAQTLADLFKGGWAAGAYARGDVVVDKGSTWLCTSETTARPGETRAWTMICRAGRNGKDASR